MAAHTVEPGECLVTIAARYGFAWKTLWEHDDNAALREQRKNPNLLFPGDVVQIPAKEAKQHSVKTGKNHEFKVKRASAMLRLRLVESGEALADEPFTLEVGGTSVKGKTDGEGKLEQAVPVAAKQAVLVLDERRQSFTLKLGHLDPAAEVSGAQARLRNLGIYSGDVDGELGPITREALETFQAASGIDVTGELDEATQGKLEEAYGC